MPAFMKSQPPGLRHFLKHAVAVCGMLLAAATAQATLMPLG